MIWKLILSHVIADFLLQTKEIAKGKLKFKNNFIHCLILFSITSIFFVNLLNLKLILMFITISLSHGIIDFCKAFIEIKIDKKFTWLLFLLDQALHLISLILILYFFYPSVAMSILSTIAKDTASINPFKSFVFLIVITFGGSYFTSAICKGFKPSQDDESLDNAGRYIGILERLIIAISVIICHYEIIGFLIAAKSIIRHNEAKKKAFTEYFLIGTFTSFIWAVLFTFLYKL